MRQFLPKSAGKIVRGIVHLAPGEAVSRVCYAAIVIFLGHFYGVVILGVYALAATISQYLQPIIDFGLMHIGARLLAQRPQLAGEIVRRVQYRRLKMAVAVLPLIVIYVFAVRLPAAMKAFLLVFSFSSAMYAVSLQWVAWGKNHLRLLGFGRAVVPVSILAFLALGYRHSGYALWWVAAGNIAGYLVQAAVFWMWWRKHQPEGFGTAEERTSIADSLAWRRTSIMGMAWLANLAFNTIDMLMLGVMSNPQQVGLYSAAYRILNQVLMAYYLLTQSLYPELSRQDTAQRLRMLRPRFLLPLLGAGTVIAVGLVATRQPLMKLVFGSQFGAASALLFVLAWAIPLDFVTSYIGNAYIAWGMEKSILVCTAIAAASNVVLNLLWIPAYGATAAAVNTLLTYLIFLVSLGLAGRFAKELARETPAVPELAR
jgi:O-antigen/teichoic acid export membrane protein